MNIGKGEQTHKNNFLLKGVKNSFKPGKGVEFIKINLRRKVLKI